MRSAGVDLDGHDSVLSQQRFFSISVQLGSKQNGMLSKYW